MYPRFEKNKLLIFFIATLLFSSCEREIPKTQNPTVEVRYEGGKAQLYRHGEPYSIKGAAGTEHLALVAEYGGNSVRTWSLHDADRILDEAHKLGLTVTLGLEIGRPTWGNDFSYWKFWEVDKKIEELRPLIEKYKNHPALLMWGVGNEVKTYGGGIRPVIFLMIDRVAKMIKEVDPNHPTMTAVDVVDEKNTLVSDRLLMPHIDVLGYNSFKTVPKMFLRVYEDKGWGKAYMVSEWGTNGHWEIPATDWGAPKEMKTSKKIELMENYWNSFRADSSMLIGSYAFYWGNKYEATHTWFSIFSEDGYRTEMANFLKYAWSGQRADNSAPAVNNLFIKTNHGLVDDNVYLESNTEYSAKAFITDPEEDTLTYRWEIRHEGNYFVEIKGYDYDMTGYNMSNLIKKEESDLLTFMTPKEEGPYRIFVFAYDGQGNVASHNIPFYVTMK